MECPLPSMPSSWPARCSTAVLLATHCGPQATDLARGQITFNDPGGESDPLSRRSPLSMPNPVADKTRVPAHPDGVMPPTIARDAHRQTGFL